MYRHSVLAYSHRNGRLTTLPSWASSSNFRGQSLAGRCEKPQAMIGAAIAKRLRMPAEIGVNKAVGHATEQQVEANADDRKKANAESEGISFPSLPNGRGRWQAMRSGPRINQREKNAETEI